MVVRREPECLTHFFATFASSHNTSLTYRMSKAFTRESDDTPERPARPRRVSSLPPGTKNYLTASGAASFRDELERIEATERPALAALPESDPRREYLMVLDDRLAQLHDTLATAEVVEPPPPPHDQVRFGATVAVRHARGETVRYRIVGVDETDIDRDWISWLSPLARALLNARLGATLRVRLPAGEEQLTISEIAYE